MTVALPYTNNAEQNLDAFSLPTPGTSVKITNYQYYTREVRASVREDSVVCHALDWADRGPRAGWKVQELPDGSFAIETHGKLATKDLASGRLVLTSSACARQTSASTWNLVPFHPGSFAIIEGGQGREAKAWTLENVEEGTKVTLTEVEYIGAIPVFSSAQLWRSLEYK